MKTQDEVVTRIKDVSHGGDLFRWRTEVLAMALDFEHARPFLTDDAKAEDWPGPYSEEDVRKDAVGYLEFAFDKAQNHRGISANRSVEKLGEYLWLLGLDYGRFNAAPYENYGVPQLFVAAEELDVDKPTDEDLVRMSQGLSCSPDGCYSGCGQ